MTEMQGLTEAEAQLRRQRGEGNDIQLQTSRSYRDIFRQNVFAFINIVLFTIGILLVIIDRVEDAIVSILIIMMNVIIGVNPGDPCETTIGPDCVPHSTKSLHPEGGGKRGSWIQPRWFWGISLSHDLAIRLLLMVEWLVMARWKWTNLCFLANRILFQRKLEIKCSQAVSV